MADLVLGTDLSGVGDLSPSLGEVSGRRALIEAVARRLITPRGGLFYDADYGFDLRQFLNGITTNAASIASQVEQEAEKDERVEQASAKVAFNGNVLTARLTIVDANGPFDFTLSIDKVTSTILTQG